MFVDTGAVPVMRDTPSYEKIVSLLTGNDLSEKIDNKLRSEDESLTALSGDDKFVDANRMESKNEKDYILKLQILKENNKSNQNGAESKDSHEQTAFEIASAVASAGNMRLQEFKSTSRDNRSDGVDSSKAKSGLLGNLPSLSGNTKNASDVHMALNLKLPGDSHTRNVSIVPVLFVF